MSIISIQPLVRRFDRMSRESSSGPAKRPDQQPTGTALSGGATRSFLRRWLTAGLLLVAALLAVLYISNAIAVNRLVNDINSIEHERDLVRSENERLRAHLLRLMSVERIGSVASERLGLVQPAQPPVGIGEGRVSTKKDASGGR